MGDQRREVDFYSANVTIVAGQAQRPAQRFQHFGLARRQPARLEPGRVAGDESHPRNRNVYGMIENAALPHRQRHRAGGIEGGGQRHRQRRLGGEHRQRVDVEAVEPGEQALGR